MSSEKFSPHLKSDTPLKPTFKQFRFPPRLDFSKFISDQDVENILHTQKLSLQRSKSNSRGRFLRAASSSQGPEGKKKAQTPSPGPSPYKSKTTLQGKRSEGGLFWDSKDSLGALSTAKKNPHREALEEHVRILAEKCEGLEELLQSERSAKADDQKRYNSQLLVLSAELTQAKSDLELESAEVASLHCQISKYSKAVCDLTALLTDLLQNLLENRVLSASRLPSMTSSFDSSGDIVGSVEDEEKKRAADTIQFLLREKLSSVLGELEEREECLRRVDQWNLPTPNSSLNLETDIRSSNKSPTSSRTDSFIMYPESVISFRNLSPSPDLCTSPTFQPPQPPALSISFEAFDQL